ncbi:MAG: 3'-5' exonuclease [Victivallales bacterium]|nr:3'-5' exonuclease [bacterium]MDD7752866.1 3'-5' exonuclease [bacterium]MDY5697394.1 3'-5' exonuclease [Victivallales bacterium]
MAEKWHELGPYTVFDFETTGMSPVRDRPVEIGAVRIETDGSTSRFSSLVNPQMPIPRRATAVHQITDEMVAEAPVFEKVGAEFLEFAKDSKLVAHNARFDLAFLQESLNRCGLAVWEYGAYDSIAIVRKAFPGMPSYSLQSLRLALSLGANVTGDAHRALYDAEITAELFTVAMNRLYRLYS